MLVFLVKDPVEERTRTAPDLVSMLARCPSEPEHGEESPMVFELAKPRRASLRHPSGLIVIMVNPRSRRRSFPNWRRPSEIAWSVTQKGSPRRPHG
jgi:hypothetical protein